MKVIKEIGKLLKEAREQRELTIDDIQKGTKIRSKYIKALEDGNFSQLPGGEIYVRGFIKNYCEIVGINPKEILELFKNLKSEDEPKANKAIVQELPSQDYKPKKENSRVIFSLFLVLLLGIGAVFAYNQFFAGDRSQTLPPELPGNNQPEKPLEPEKPEPPMEEPVVVTPTPKVEYSIVINNQYTTEYKIINVDRMRLQISIPTGENTWIRVRGDGKILFEGIMSGGQERSWEAENNFELNVGRPMVTYVVINELDIGRLGGEARIIKFSI